MEKIESVWDMKMQLNRVIIAEEIQNKTTLAIKK